LSDERIGDRYDARRVQLLQGVGQRASRRAMAAACIAEEDEDSR
jgi:hypothetical protein